MRNFVEKLGILPYLLSAGLMIFLGLSSLNYLTENVWPFDPNRLDIARAVAEERVNAPALFEAANGEILFAFVMSAGLAAIGLALPFSYLLNKRLAREYPGFFIVLRQAMWFGVWVMALIYMQMNRALGVAVVVLTSIVLILFEIMLQVRTTRHEQSVEFQE